MLPKNSGGSSKFPGGHKVIHRTAQTAFVRVFTPRHHQPSRSFQGFWANGHPLVKLYTLFLKTQDHENHTVLHGTYPFSSVKGVPHLLRTQSQPFSSHLLSTKQMPLERYGGSLRYHLFGSHHCIKEIHAFMHDFTTCAQIQGHPTENFEKKT